MGFSSEYIPLTGLCSAVSDIITPIGDHYEVYILSSEETQRVLERAEDIRAPIVGNERDIFHSIYEEVQIRREW